MNVRELIEALSAVEDKELTVIVTNDMGEYTEAVRVAVLESADYWNGNGYESKTPAAEII